MLEYAQSLYMCEGVAPMVEKMANGKAIDVALITNEFLKWAKPSTH